VSGVPQLVVRICKLGKSVGERFAGRYFEEIGVGVRFYADSLEEQLIAKKLPGIMAASFDSSCAISALMGIEETREANYEMKVKPLLPGINSIYRWALKNWLLLRLSFIH
jgi:hypothetical protein